MGSTVRERAQRQQSGLVARATQVSQGATVEARTYNEYGELASLTGTHGGAVQYAEVMDSVPAPRDKLGRVVTRVDSLPGRSTSWEYHYDVQGRLDEVQRDGVLPRSDSRTESATCNPK